MEYKNILIYGTGGVGGYFGGKLANAKQSKGYDYNITFIARGKHLEEIKKNGLILKTALKGEEKCIPDLATEKIANLCKPDLCLICVKEYDLENAVKNLDTIIDNNTIIMPLLNGIDIFERIRKVTKNGIVLPACVYIGTHIEKPGIVCQNGGTCTILFGKDPEYMDFNEEKLIEFFNKSEIKAQYFHNPLLPIWEKFIFIAGFGLVTAAENKTIGEVMENNSYKNKVRTIIKEIYEISKMKNIDWTEDIIENTLNKGLIFSYETKTSFQRDVEKGSFNELELFGGVIIKLGKEYNIIVNNTFEMYEKIKNKRVKLC